MTCRYLNSSEDRIRHYMDTLGQLALVRDVPSDLMYDHNSRTEGTFHRCDSCGNEDPDMFEADVISGVIICLGVEKQGCGAVASTVMDETNQFQKGEGEEDEGQCGRPPDPLFSDAYNSGTDIMKSASSQFKGGSYRRNGKGLPIDALARGLDKNWSNFDEKRARKTRVGYKDEHKIKAFQLMGQCRDTFKIDGRAFQHGKVVFAVHRNEEERVYDFPAVIGACLMLGIEKIKREDEEAGSPTRTVEEKKPFIEAAKVCTKCNQIYSNSKDLQFHDCPADQEVREPPLKKIKKLELPSDDEEDEL
jgi:hypothetical protein